MNSPRVSRNSKVLVLRQRKFSCAISPPPPSACMGKPRGVCLGEIVGTISTRMQRVPGRTALLCSLLEQFANLCIGSLREVLVPCADAVKWFGGVAADNIIDEMAELRADRR